MANQEVDKWHDHYIGESCAGDNKMTLTCAVLSHNTMPQCAVGMLTAGMSTRAVTISFNVVLDHLAVQWLAKVFTPGIFGIFPILLHYNLELK